MRPLQPIGMGLLLLFIHAGRFDFLPDPLGWLIILAGVSALPEAVERRRILMWLAGVAGAVSVPLWWPHWGESVRDGDPSLWWAVNLPQLGFVLMFALSLYRAAKDAEDESAARWWQLAATLSTLAALLPILVFGGGVEALDVPTFVVSTGTLLMVVVLCFSHAGRPWAITPDPAEPSGTDPDAL